MEEFEIGRFGILLSQEASEKLVELSWYMEDSPEDVINNAIHTLYQAYEQQAKKPRTHSLEEF